jgi:sarcosine oxidase, subunit beta
MSSGYQVAIVGAGNLGMWTAYHLARRGVGRIAVCERGWAGWGATSRSAGMIRQQGGSVSAVRLGMLSREWYMRLGAELGLDSGFRETGYYVMAMNDAERTTYQELVQMRRACGLEHVVDRFRRGARVTHSSTGMRSSARPTARLTATFTDFCSRPRRC